MDEREFGGQRKEKRVEVNREFASADAFVGEYVSNISTSGAFIVTDDPLPKGTKVALRFSIIADGIELIEGEGEVVRTARPGPGRKGGMGVVFTKLTPSSKALIEKLVTRKPKRKPVILG